MSAKRFFSIAMAAGTKVLALLVLALPATSVLAQAPAATGGDARNSVFYRYPPDSIHTEEVADRLLAELANERTIVDSRYAEEQRKCAPQFFVNNCMEAAVDQRREAMLKLRTLENEANLFKRRQRVIERDLALEESRKKDAAKALSVVPASTAVPKKSQEKELPVTPVSEGPSSGERIGKGPTTREIEHNKRVESRKQEDAAQAGNRAEKIAAYERKLKASEARQREIAQLKAEKENKEKAKAAVSPAVK